MDKINKGIQITKGNLNAKNVGIGDHNVVGDTTSADKSRDTQEI